MSGKDHSFIYRTAKNSLSGTAAGIAVCLTGHPFDTLKVRLQTQPVKNPVYKGLIDCFVKTLKWEGIGGLYKGVGSPIVGQMIFRATLFSSYYNFSSMLAGDRTSCERHEYFLAGAMTGAVASVVEGPIDLFKTKMQIQIIRAKSGGKVQYRNVFHAGYMIAKTYGVRGCWQGLSATWLRNIPAYGIFFGCYEIIRRAFIPEGGTVNDAPPTALMLAGGIGGFNYWFFTYPTDVVKSAMMSDDSDKAKRRFRNIPQCIRHLYVNEGGIKRFFTGFTPCLLRSIPANATMCLTLELCRRLF